MTFGTVHHPRERAALLVSALVSAGYGGQSMYQGDMEECHLLLSKEKGWAPVSWLAICREMKLLGLRKYTLATGGGRLTFYEIAEPPTNVTQLRKPA
jgi:hypothetical protein